MAEDNNQDLPNYSVKPKSFGFRYIQSFLYFMAIFGSTANRCAISVGIVPMTSNSSNPNFETYNWDELTRGILLSGGSCGFLLAVLPASFLYQWFGAKRVTIVALSVSSVVVILTPIFSPLGWVYTFVFSVITGFGTGIVTTCVYSLVPKWTHPSERSLSIAFSSGLQMGIFAMMVVSGPIALSQLGWPGIFYISGGMGICIAITWLTLVFETPAEHPYISDEERIYLEMNTRTTQTKKRLPIPWCSIITSPAIVTLTIAICGYNFGFFIFLSQMPTYINAIHHFDLKATGFLSGLPYLLMGILAIFIAPISDFLINNGYLTRLTARKLFNTIGQWVPMCCLLGLAFFENLTATTAVILLIIAISICAGSNAGCVINHFDLSPNFSGAIFSINFIFASILSSLGPVLAGFVVDDLSDRSKWNIMFYITAGGYFIGNLGFLIFGKANIQPWNEENYRSNEKELESMKSLK